MLNEEMIGKAREAKSVEELLALAKESEIELTTEQAKDFFAQLNPPKGELSDDGLEAVVGGVSDGTEPFNPNDIRYYDFVRIENYKCRSCGRVNPTAIVTELIERHGDAPFLVAEFQMDCCKAVSVMLHIGNTHRAEFSMKDVKRI